MGKELKCEVKKQQDAPMVNEHIEKNLTYLVTR